jgi:hypothetical protein
MNIDIIKNEFETIKETKFLVENIFKRLQTKIDYLKQIYTDYQGKQQSTDLVLTLDSFHFQTKFIDIEYKNYYNIFRMFLNRLYGDYYKFYKYTYYNVINQIDGFTIKFNNKFPSYKDLELKDYSFTDTISIHSELIKIVNELQSYLITLKHENKTDEIYSSYGINIDNLVTVNNYKNVVLSEKINLIVNCLKSYSEFQSRFLERFALKLKFIYAQTVADIRIEDNEVVEKNIDKDILSELESPSKKEIVKILNHNKTPSVTSESSNDPDTEIEEEVTINKSKFKSTTSISFKKLLVTTLCFIMICSVSHPNDTQFSTELVLYNF